MTEAALALGQERPSHQGPLWRALVAHRHRVQVAIDAVAWTLALLFATVARFDFEWARVDPVGLAAIIPLAVCSQVVAGLASGIYLGRWRFGSFEEVAGLARAAAITTVLLFALNLWAVGAQMVPRSVPLAGGVTALVLMGAARYTWRLLLERRRRPSGDGASRLLVFGAGDGGVQVVTAMLRDPGSPYVPVALLDDDPEKRNLRLSGVPVVGGRRRLARAVEQYRPDALLIAIPSAGADLVGELTDLAHANDLDVKVLPPVRELFGGPVALSDIRDLTPADLLGRHEVETDLASIAGYLTGKRVLVTGAGGSIGSELCRQIHRFAPATLVMLDRDESALHAVQLSISGRAVLDAPNLALVDIRDRTEVERAFVRYRPEVVFHAAALKHLVLLETHPGESVKTNVWGTLGLLEVAARTGVERFVNISTDKAADPTSVLGYSKRLAERLTAWFAAHEGGTYLSVRFGNVLGSRGSVLDTFHAQIAAGGPVTVTDPDVTRFFMTVQEAVQLVVQAGAIGHDGEALVLDMGTPVRIDDVARRLVAQADRPIRIEYTQLGPGEKLHEALLGRDEVGAAMVHPLISHVTVPPLDPDEARRLDPSTPPAALVDELRRLCGAGERSHRDAVSAEGGR